MLDRLVACGNKAPEATEEFEPHVIIRTIRISLRMTQAQLARRAGLPQSHLAKIEVGRVDVQLSTLRRILAAMYCGTVVLPKFQKPPRAALTERIREFARRKVARVTGAMERDDDRTVRALIRSEEKRLLSGSSSEIWDEDAPSGGASVVRDRSSVPVRIVDKEDDRDTLRFWLAQPPEARIDAMEFLRRQCCLVTGRKSLPRIVRSIQLRDRHT
ncbi:MAG: helix-turn-helix domain-containing protein [Elusimicrobia bacterium]|nr:helix-turn-helix domain-containing protein [Elusimicrobiota bacterium]